MIEQLTTEHAVEDNERLADPGVVEVMGTRAVASAEAQEKDREPAKFSLKIDHDILDAIKLPSVEENLTQGAFVDSDKEQKLLEGKVTELGNLLETVRRLPEELRFEPGITLVVSAENGGGKSSVAKALYLAAKFEAARQEREKDGFDGRDPRASAYESIFESGGREAEERAMSGLGAEFAKAMLGVKEFAAGNFIAYTDVGRLYGAKADLIQRNSQDRVHTDVSSRTGTDVVSRTKGAINLAEVGSTRQMIDIDLRKLKERSGKGRYNDGATAGIFFADQPEEGISQFRQVGMKGEIEAVFGSAEKGDIVIVPTNSMMLFLSDLPRIDLRYPERGIHRPSDYEDHDGLDELRQEVIKQFSLTT
jgi:predicted ATPase